MDRFDKRTRSKIMSKIRSKNTGIELQMRKILWHKGLRYRIHYGKEKIDIAFPRAKLAVFIDGCFWHNCPIHGHLPSTNTGYWSNKLERNAERAENKKQRLVREGWLSIHLWEHEISEDPEKCAYIVENQLSQRIH